MKIYKISEYELEIERPEELVIERPSSMKNAINDFPQNKVAENISKINKFNIRKIDPTDSIFILSEYSEMFADGLKSHIRDLSSRSLPKTFGQHSNLSSFINNFDYVQKSITEKANIQNPRSRGVSNEKMEELLSAIFTVRYSSPSDFIGVIYKINDDGSYSSSKFSREIFL